MSTSSDCPIVGIDLGTTNSVVAAIVNGKVQVLAEDGEKLLPSVVGFDMENKLVTGTVARNQLVAFPDRTLASVKRKMGTMNPLKMGDQEFTPPEVSAMILRRLRDRASRVLGQPVTRAVITIPAFFDENQRQATREAGELAGLKVERIINEPTAATLVYHAGSGERKHLVVYDLGGGTFDVSVVRMEAGVVEVLSSKGDTQLGGDDFDALLMKHVAEEFLDQHEIELREHASSRFRLMRACEQAKCRLSVEETVRIAEEFIATKQEQPLNLDISVSRGQYEELIRPLVDRTIECVDDALRDAGMTINQIDDLVLVGGSTRTPLVQELLRQEFLREPSHAVDPDLAVALGAATQAAMLDGQAVGPVLVDVTGHTLGIEALDDSDFYGSHLIFSPIIHRNSPLPASHEQAYHKVHDDQKAAQIRIFQGEHPDVERNHFIGEFTLDLEAGGGDRGKIVVRFDLTLDGTLRVVATQSATGVRKELNLHNALSQFQADDRDRAQARLGSMFDQSDELLDDQDFPSSSQWLSREEQDQPTNSSDQQPSKYPAAAALLTKARTMQSEVHGDDAEDLRALAQQLEEAIAQNDPESVKSLCDELDDVLFYVQ